MSKIRFIFFLITLSFLNVSFATDEHALKCKLIGTWKLVSTIRESLTTHEKTADYGANPSGYIIYTPEGRMMEIMVRGDRPTPKVSPDNQKPNDADALALYRSMSAYTGTYKIEGDKIIHHVDVSWNQFWTGTNQVRYFKFNKDNEITLTMKPFVAPVIGLMTVHLTWKKVNLPATKCDR